MPSFLSKPGIRIAVIAADGTRFGVGEWRADQPDHAEEVVASWWDLGFGVVPLDNGAVDLLDRMCATIAAMDEEAPAVIENERARRDPHAIDPDEYVELPVPAAASEVVEALAAALFAVPLPLCPACGGRAPEHKGAPTCMNAECVRCGATVL